MRRASFVSAGLLKPKKDNALAKKHLYLNFGLLSMATTLSTNAWSVRVFHGGFAAPQAMAHRIAVEIASEPLSPLFLSLPSYLALPWACLFAAEVRRLLPVTPLIVGGRWVVSSGAEWIQSRLPEASLIVYGTAESRIERLARCDDWHLIPGTNRHENGMSATLADDLPCELNYALIEDYQSYQPSIEVARGCTMVCHFCPEAGKGGIGMREPSTVIKALGLAARAYGTERISPYFEASLFSPTDAWADEFHHQYREAGHNIKWRCESRVDVMTPKQVARLADAGLRVLDLGLESASIRQLTAMGKTREPCRYLRRASDLLKACADFGVWAKVNVMLYAGETPDTITETTDWLEAHRKCIKGISAGAVAVYGPSHVSGQFIAEIRRLGASIVNERSLEEVGYSGVHLSAELDEQAAIEVSRSISRSFMSASDYFDLKSFSYFPRHYSFADFEADVRNSDSSQLPFVSGT